MTKLAMNLNEKVWIRVTPRGKTIWDEYEKRWADMLTIEPRPLPPVDADGWSEWQLWEVMKTFGQYMVMGLDPPIEMTIQIKPKSLEAFT